MRNTSKVKGLEDAERLGELLSAIGRGWDLRDPLVGDCAADTHLTPSQIHALIWLGADGALTMGELARRCGITEKTITGVVDRLERDGLLQRVRDQPDRRVVRVVLAKKGTAAFAEIRAHMIERFRLFLGLLEAGDREALFRILERLRDKVAQASTRSAKESP